MARSAAAELAWPLPAELTDAVLEERLFAAGGPKPGMRRRLEPDWAALVREMKADQCILDIECVDGTIDRHILDHRPDLSISGIGVSARPSPQIAVVTFDDRNILFDDASFDVAMFIDVLHHTESLKILLRQAKRVAMVRFQLRSAVVSALIYDIGLHDGRDTGHYLREGCQVVAIDANPSMCAAAQAQFRNYLRTGQLKIINRGVAECKSQLEFWVCDDVSEWSSFHRDIASRNGAKHHSITVDCVAIVEIIDKFGVPDYMKIDIEGNDRICIAGLTNATAPRYISMEMDHSCGEQDLQILAGLGYQDFKVICQNNSWHQVTKRNIGFYEWRPDHFIIRRLRRLRAAPSRLLAGRRLGESGPWGEKTSGAWHSFDHAHSVWRSLRELDQRQGTHGLGWWFDVHARKQAMATNTSPLRAAEKITNSSARAAIPSRRRSAVRLRP